MATSGITQNNGNWGTTGATPTQTPTSGTAAATPTDLQFKQAGAQTGIDLFLAEGSNFDLDAWDAENRGSLAGQLTPDQINTYIQTARKAFQAAATTDQAGASAATAGATTGSAAMPMSYQQLTSAVAQQVLPTGEPPQPLYVDPNAADNNTYAKGGSDLGASLPNNSNIEQITATTTKNLMANGASLHAAAIFNQSLVQAYQTTQASAGASATAAAQAAAAAAAASAPPALTYGASPEVTAWYNGTGPADFKPTADDWTKLVAYVKDPNTSQDVKTKTIAQIQKKNPTWATNLTNAVADTAGTTAQQAAKTYAPYMAALPGLATGDATAQKLASSFTSPDFGNNMTKDDFASVGSALVAMKKQNPDNYAFVISHILPQEARTAITKAVDNAWNGKGGQFGPQFDPSDGKKSTNLKNYFLNVFSEYKDPGKGGADSWYKGGQGDVSKNPNGHTDIVTKWATKGGE